LDCWNDDAIDWKVDRVLFVKVVWRSRGRTSEDEIEERERERERERDEQTGDIEPNRKRSKV
jgi:hypothetical protein